MRQSGWHQGALPAADLPTARQPLPVCPAPPCPVLRPCSNALACSWFECCLWPARRHGTASTVCTCPAPGLTARSCPTPWPCHTRQAARRLPGSRAILWRRPAALATARHGRHPVWQRRVWQHASGGVSTRSVCCTSRASWRGAGAWLRLAKLLPGVLVRVSPGGSLPPNLSLRPATLFPYYLSCLQHAARDPWPVALAQR